VSKPKPKPKIKPKDAASTAAEEAKRERRLERRRQEAAARRRAARRRRLRNVVRTGAAIAAVLVGGWFVFRPDAEVDGVSRFSSDGRDHVTGATFDSATPTSGDHNPSAPGCGGMSDPLERDLAVHGLEHGVVVVWHRPDVDERTLAAAEELLSEWSSHWILSPNPDIDAPFVATAWNRLKSFDEPGPDLRKFVDTYRRRGPERVDCAA
jgi:hypothetical protein